MTLKLNIKLDTENLTGGFTAIHTLPALMCFKFLPNAQKILNCDAIMNNYENKSDMSKFYRLPTLAHLVLPILISQPTSKTKRANFPVHNKTAENKLYFRILILNSNIFNN
jgi:hypothetical protein